MPDTDSRGARGTHPAHKMRPPTTAGPDAGTRIDAIQDFAGHTAPTPGSERRRMDPETRLVTPASTGGLRPGSPAEVTLHRLGTCPADQVVIGVTTTGTQQPTDVDAIPSQCLCGQPLELRRVTQAQYEAEVGADDPEDGDEDAPLLEDEDGAPYPDEVQEAHRLALSNVVAEAAKEAGAKALRLLADELRRMSNDAPLTSPETEAYYVDGLASGLRDAADEAARRAAAIEAGEDLQ